jgi:hypothetical protein
LELKSYSSDIVLSTSKFTTELPLGLGTGPAQELQAGQA